MPQLRERDAGEARRSVPATPRLQPIASMPAAPSIAPAAKPARRGASAWVKPIDKLPPALNGRREAAGGDAHDNSETQGRRGIAAKSRAAGRLIPDEDVPSGGKAQTGTETQPICGLAATIARIVELQRLRKFCITAQSRCDRSIEALIATVALDYRPDVMTPAQRKALFRRARDIRKAVERGGKGQIRIDTRLSNALSPILPAILLSAASRKHWDTYRDKTEGEMGQLAGLLPVAAWAQSIAGFGLNNLAILIGEIGKGRAGNGIGDFATVSRLWKRLGLAVFNGRRQQRVKDKALADLHGFSPVRRAEVFVVGSVSVFMAQKPGMTYRDEYDRRRALTAPRVAATADLPKGNPQRWSLRRCDMDARRVMTKALVRDLWIEWRAA
jgi:hypothetical protein